MILERERNCFDAKKSEWLIHHEGKFVLIREGEVLGFFDTADLAYVAGLERFGNVPLLIKPILRDEPIEQAPALMCGLIHACP